LSERYTEGRNRVSFDDLGGGLNRSSVIR
jgi:hypothetical protein